MPSLRLLPLLLVALAAALAPAGPSFSEEGDTMGIDVNSVSNWLVSQEPSTGGTKGEGSRPARSASQFTVMSCEVGA